MDLQLAEAAAERHLLGRRDVLVAEYQHVVVEVGAVQAAEVFRPERTRQVEPTTSAPSGAPMMGWTANA